MSVAISERLRERHGLTLLGAAFHVGFYIIVLASALTLMEHRPTVVNVEAEKILSLSGDEVSILVNGLQVIECDDGSLPSYRVTFLWLRAETVTPNAQMLPLTLGAPVALTPEVRTDAQPTHVKMESRVACQGEPPVSREIGPVRIRR